MNPEPRMTPGEDAKPISNIVNLASSVFGAMRQRTVDFGEKIRPRFDAEPDLLPCEKHRIPQAKHWDDTLWKSWRATDPGAEPRFALVRVPCPECEREATMAEEARHWLKKGVPSRLADATFDSFDAESSGQVEALRQAMAFATSKTPFALLLGDLGTGKGHLSVSAMRSCTRRGLFITHADLLMDLRATYGVTGGTKEFIERFVDVDFLVLDEFGIAPTGKDEAPLLYQILAGRHDKRLKTAITSNLELSELRDALGHRIIDRMREDHVVIVMRGTSWRARKS